jgi:hypothetical protein
MIKFKLKFESFLFLNFKLLSPPTSRRLGPWYHTLQLQATVVRSYVVEGKVTRKGPTTDIPKCDHGESNVTHLT